MTATSTTDRAIQRKLFGSGITTSIISKQRYALYQNVKYSEEFGLLIKSVSVKC